MRVVRPVAFVALLTIVAAVGAAVALLLLSTIGGPSDDPVGRLRPVLSGLPTATAPVGTTRTEQEPEGETETEEEMETERPDGEDD